MTLFGKHTTAYNVSIERKNFKPIEVSDLKNLGAQKVFERILQNIWILISFKFFQNKRQNNYNWYNS